MFWKEKYNLWQIKRSVKADDFKQRLWRQLDSEFISVPQPKAILLLRPIMMSGLLILTLFVIGGVSTSVYAYTSPAVNQSHPLFVLKKGLEKAEVALARTPEKKLEVSLKHQQKRLQEIDRLKNKGKFDEKILSDFNKGAEEILSQTPNVTSLEKQGKIIETLGEQNVEAVKKLKEVKNKSDEKAQTQIEQIIVKQKERTEKILDKVKEQQSKIEEKQKENLEKLREKIKNQ